jgi:hypothetical protein
MKTFPPSNIRLAGEIFPRRIQWRTADGFRYFSAAKLDTLNTPSGTIIFGFVGTE